MNPKGKLITLKRQYLEGDSEARLDRTTLVEIQHQKDCLDRKFSCMEAVIKSKDSQRRHCERFLQDIAATKDEEKFTLLKWINTSSKNNEDCAHPRVAI